MKTDNSIIGHIAPKSIYSPILYNSNPTPPDSILCYWADSKPEDLWGDVDGEIGLYVGFDRYTANNPFIASPFQPVLGSGFAPSSNTGDILSLVRPDCPADIDTYHTGYQSIEINGKTVLVPSPDSSCHSNSAFIDCLSVVAYIGDVLAASPIAPYYRLKTPAHESDFVPCLLRSLIPIIGDLGFTMANGGRNGYTTLWHIGKNGCYGHLAFGGNSQRGSFQLSFTGVGLSVIRDRLKDLYPYLVAIQARISRCDVAVDSFAGEYSPDAAAADYKVGKFKPARGKAPVPDCRGNWIDDSVPGRTFYLGSRDGSPKFLRVYHKAHELMGDLLYNQALDPEHEFHRLINWNRTEVELKPAGVSVIPLDIILDPSKYFAGLYPALKALLDSPVEHIQRVKYKVKATLERTKSFIKRQFSGSLQCLDALGMLDEVIQDCLNHRVSKRPAWFQAISDLSFQV